MWGALVVLIAPVHSPAKLIMTAVHVIWLSPGVYLFSPASLLSGKCHTISLPRQQFPIMRRIMVTQKKAWLMFIPPLRMRSIVSIKYAGEAYRRILFFSYPTCAKKMLVFHRRL